MGAFNEWSEGDGERHHSQVLWFFDLFLSGRGRQSVVLMECEPLVCGRAQGVTGCWISQRCNRMLDRLF